MGKLITPDKAEFEAYLKSLPENSDLLFCRNPYQSPIVRYLNHKVEHACFWMDFTGYYSEWHDFRGSKTLPLWVKQYLYVTQEIGRISPAEALQYLKDSSKVKQKQIDELWKKFHIQQ